MKITWLTQGSFMFESSEARILVDPYMSDCLEAKGVKRMVPYPLAYEELKPDMLICTHDHLDHLDPETVENIAAMYPDCVMAGPVSCCNHFKELGVEESRIQLLEEGTTVSFKDVTITPVLALHSDPEAVGVVIEADGKKVYLSGDSEYDEKLVTEQTKGCDAILICINGRLGNMTLEQALDVVKAAKPFTALPMHYGLFAENTADPQPFIDGCQAAGIKSFEMELGKANII